MFFMMGITEGHKELDFHQPVVCPGCGAYGSYSVFMTYMVLSLFFIPVLKWKRQYFVRTSCCGRLYRLEPEVGKRVAEGQQVEIRPGQLEPMEGCYGQRRCGNCGYTTAEDFEYCPKCGQRF